MAYKISTYSKTQAKKLGVVIKPSTKKNKKIAVFKNKKKVADIGDSRYNDFTTYTKLEKKAQQKQEGGYIKSDIIKQEKRKVLNLFMPIRFYGN